MKNEIKKAIEKSLEKMNIESEVVLTEARGHADFASNIALTQSKKLGKNPMDLANEIVDNIESDLISSIEVAAPGFINIFVNSDVFKESVDRIITEGDNFGKGNNNKYINIEYVSANPTGHLHIGHARGAVLGSVLTKVLSFAGNKVDQEYYINDAGNQITVLAKSVRARYLQALGIDEPLPEESYGGDDIKLVANYFVDKYSDTLKDEGFEKFANESKEFLLNEIKDHLAKYNVNIELYSSEQSIYDNDSIKPALKKLESHTYTQDGALWLDTTSQGDDKDRVLVKSDGAYTYFTPDIAYHDIKLSRGYDELINIWGADHIGYIKRMEVALGYLGLPKEKLDILTVQMVKLYQNGEELKMSKRAGTSYRIIELLDEVGVDAARWFMVDRSNNSDFVFDLDKAKKQTSDNPVFNVQYTHARANQLIAKSNVEPKAGEYDAVERELINQMNKFPEIIEIISNSHKVHLLPQYILDLSGMFNSWYSNKKAIGTENEASLIALSIAFKQVIKNGLSLLGINAPDSM